LIEFYNQTNFDFNVDSLKEIYEYLTNKDIELILTTDEEIQKLNKQFRNKDKPTDVLSFPLEDAPNTPLGSIVISIDTAKKQAQKHSHSVEEEIKLLFIHGLLHLLGYDHEIDNGEMREKEKEIIKKFNLPDSLIVRN